MRAAVSLSRDLPITFLGKKCLSENSRIVFIVVVRHVFEAACVAACVERCGNCSLCCCTLLKGILKGRFRKEVVERKLSKGSCQVGNG